MSRNVQPMNDNTTFIRGTDHVLGAFFDIQDKRFAKSGDDPQGEGFVFEWSQTMGITTNFINADVEEVGNDERMLELVNEFIESIFQTNLI